MAHAPLSQMREEIEGMSRESLNTPPGLKQTLPFKHCVILVAKCIEMYVKRERKKSINRFSSGERQRALFKHLLCASL